MMISYPWAKFASARMVNQLRIGFKVFGIILCHRFRLSVFLFSIWRYLEERHLFRVGFHEVIILVYKNLVLGNLVADWLMIWSEFIWTIFRMKNEGMNLPKWTRTILEFIYALTCIGWNWTSKLSAYENFIDYY